MSITPTAPGWSGRAAWSVLDCAFGDGHGFLALWAAWRADPQRPRMLHYVAIASTAPSPPPCDSTHPLYTLLTEACRHLQPGFNRIALDSGHLSLTLCWGEPSAMVDAQDFQADQIIPSPQWLASDKWAVKALARCCKRGTQITLPSADAQTLPALWTTAGFHSCHTPTPIPGLHTIAVYEPAWTIKRTRHDTHAWQGVPGHCAVVGAGLSGASVARALALRGWQVTVLDCCTEPAGGASGLPVGLVVPHVSADDSPRSRLSRSGARMTLAQARQHLQDGSDWAPSGVTEMRLNPHSGLREPLWHAMAGWIKPSALIKAWLRTPGISFRGQSQIARLACDDSGWHLFDAAGLTLARADVVVLANAMGCRALLQDMPLSQDLAEKMPLLHAMYGTVTMGSSKPGQASPATPVNGLGSFVPAVPSADGAFWAAGATFEAHAAALADLPGQHRANLQRLRSLLPQTAQALESQFEDPAARAWRSERCVTHDRLPWVGPVDLQNRPGLWISAGMGSRGLSFCALCADVLAARLGGEPLPMEIGLLRNIDINRPKSRKKHA